MFSFFWRLLWQFSIGVARRNILFIWFSWLANTICTSAKCGPPQLQLCLVKSQSMLGHWWNVSEADTSACTLQCFMTNKHVTVPLLERWNLVMMAFWLIYDFFFSESNERNTDDMFIFYLWNLKNAVLLLHIASKYKTTSIRIKR